MLPNEKEIISLESNIDYVGLPYISPLFNAITGKRVLTVTYQGFKDPVPYEFEFHPYYLKQFNTRWFVFGYDPNRKDLKINLALDRIQKFEECNKKYQNDATDWTEYFSDFIGVTKHDGDPIEIKLQIIDDLQAAYIRTNPLHETQKPMRKSSTGFETSIRVIPNHELEKLILSFGDRIKVLSPKSFQKKIAERAKGLFALHDGVSN